MTDTVAYTKNHAIGAFLVGLAVGLGAYYVWDNRSIGAHSPADKARTENSSDKTEVAESVNSVTADDQFAGFTATVKRATLAHDGWIVIQEDVDGKPLYLLGATRRDAGTYENVDVELLRNTEEGNTYYAVIYADDGDRQFDNKKDFPVTTKDGNPIMDAFEIVRR